MTSRAAFAPLLGAALALSCADGDAPRGPPTDGGCSAACAGGAAEVGSGGAAGSEADPELPPDRVGGAAGDSSGDQGGGGQGDGGVGGPTDAGAGSCPSAGCFDYDPCTTSECQHGRCLHVPSPDGTECSDDDACTALDRCVAGVCVGQPQKSEPALVGGVPLFGGFRAEEPGELQGLVSVLSKEHVVFADRTVRGAGPTILTLARVTPTGLELAHQVVSPLRITPRFSSNRDWTFRLAASIAQLSATRFVFTSANEGLELYDIERGRLKLIASSDLSFQDPYDTAAEAERIWTCSPTLRSSAVASDGVLSPGVEFNVSCQGLGLSPDGKRLFATGSQGLSVVSLEADPPLLLFTDKSIGRLNSFSASDTLLVGIEVLVAGEPGDLVLLRSTDLSLLTRLEASFAAAPLAAALSGGELFVQWRRGEAQDCRITLERYALTANGLEPRDAALLRQSACGDKSSAGYGNPVSLSVKDGLLAIQPWRSLLRDETTSMQPVTGPQHGAVERLLSKGAEHVVGVGPDSVHRFDLSDLQQPLATEGGKLLGPVVGRLRIVSGNAEPLLANVPEGVNALQLSQEHTEITQIDAIGASLPRVAATVWLANGPSHAGSQARVDSAAGMLFQATWENLSYRVRRFSFGSGLNALNGMKLQSDLDLDLPVLDSPGFPTSLGWHFAPSRSGTQVTLLETRRSEDGLSDQQRVSLFSLAGARAELLAAIDVAAQLPVAIANDRALIIGDPLLHVFAIDQANFRSLARRENVEQREVRRVLRWDGERAHLATLEWHDGQPVAGLWVLSGVDLTEIAFYPTPDEVLSITNHGQHLLVAMKTGIAVAVPACR